ncbi:MAG: hypothetical protein FJX42_06175 [Alphaproteobacteria bacterium]|nr:hypothetical protein [Alphaproteobacteria bacterium]
MIAVLLVAAACYVPIRFDAEIDINRTGHYAMEFDGYIVDLPLFEGLSRGKIGGTEEQKKVQTIRDDFARDSGTRTVEYQRRGIFRVHWKTQGDITRSKMVTFIRRNAAMLTLSYSGESGILNVYGASLTAENIKRLADLGLGSEGEIRLSTNAKVMSHNATKVTDAPKKGPGFKLYVWQIRGFENPPKLSIALH